MTIIQKNAKQNKSWCCLTLLPVATAESCPRSQSAVKLSPWYNLFKIMAKLRSLKRLPCQMLSIVPSLRNNRISRNLEKTKCKWTSRTRISKPIKGSWFRVRENIRFLSICHQKQVLSSMMSTLRWSQPRSKNKSNITSMSLRITMTIVRWIIWSSRSRIRSTSMFQWTTMRMKSWWLKSSSRKWTRSTWINRPGQRKVEILNHQLSTNTW